MTTLRFVLVGAALTTIAIGGDAATRMVPGTLASQARTHISSGSGTTSRAGDKLPAYAARLRRFDARSDASPTTLPVITAFGVTGFPVPVWPADPSVLGPNCSWQTATRAVPAPVGIEIARLPDPPASLSASVSAAFSATCAAQSDLDRGPGIPLYLSRSMVKYSGSGGMAALLTMRPSPELLSAGMILGKPDGSLADSTPLYSDPLEGGGTNAFANNVMFYKHGLIVQLSGDLALNQLVALAAKVVVS